LILTVLQETVAEYLATRHSDDPSLPHIPVVRALATPVEELKERAQNILAALSSSALQAELIATVARTGGGTMPRSEIPSAGLVLRHPSLKAEELAERLRSGVPPVVGYVDEDALRLDLRTVFPDQDEELGRLLQHLAE